MLASGFLLPEFQKPKRLWVNELKETSSRLTAPPHRFPAIRECPIPCPIPCRHSNSPCGPGFCNFSALVGVSMHPPANAFLSKALGYIKSQKPAGGEPSYSGVYISHYLWWLMFFNMIFFMKSGCFWVLVVTGVSRALARAPSHLLGAP